MKSFKVNARVKEGFNDKTKLDENGHPYKWEENEIIKDMDRDRFDYLKSLGLVEENKSFTNKSEDERE